MSLLGPRDIVGIEFDAPEGWYDVELLGETGSDDWPERQAAALDAAPIVPQLRALQQVLHAEDPTGATRARVFVPVPSAGVINAYQTYELLQLEVDDSPESYLAATDAESGRREPGYEVIGYRSWRSAHPLGELVGFTHLTALADSADADDALLEQRVVFAIFPVGSAQAFHTIFRSGFIGGFDDMVADTQAIVDSVRVTLGEAA
ncbi:hypothetical protein [Leifsonia shinshuensis]|uniref:hypothetical protein n=1 Tax=Leifsonia shinshuensis TaxID=150026 RepID=UPI00215632CC|nr:hypothetical protein [Leifsonia shinshuensis]